MTRFPLPLDPALLRAAETLIEWHRVMGVGTLEGEEAGNNLVPHVPPPVRPSLPPAPAPVTPAVLPFAAVKPSHEALETAHTLAESARTLAELEAHLARFDGCALKNTAKSLVFGDGNPKARVMLVGEAPGRDEDIEGRPFVGRSGKLLDKMLAAVGFSRQENVYIANVIYWRPPGNRDPSDAEIALCRPFIMRQIALVNPDFLVFLGAQPVRALLGGEAAKKGIRRLRGEWLSFPAGARDITALPTYHPAYLLRNPIEKRAAWHDFLALRAAFDRLEGEIKRDGS